jgi:ABC-type multidrug transport system fused ATPase/permease subunit
VTWEVIVISVWEYTVGEAFLTMLWFFLFFIWIWLLISVFGDIFRSDDLSGWGKALWTVFVIVLPYLGVFVYLIARGKEMGEHRARDASRREAQMRSYVQDVAGGGSTADEIERLAKLQSQGAISEEEFRQAKAKLLA